MYWSTETIVDNMDKNSMNDILEILQKSDYCHAHYSIFQWSEMPLQDHMYRPCKFVIPSNCDQNIWTELQEEIVSAELHRSHLHVPEFTMDITNYVLSI